MKFILGLGPLGALAQSAAEHNSVVEFLEEYKGKVQGEKNQAETDFAKQSEWFSGSIDKIETNLERNRAELQETNDGLEASQAKQAALKTEISDLNTQVEKAQQDLAAAKAIRKEESVRYAQEKQDLDDMIDALVQVEEIIKNMPSDVKIESFLQERIESKMSPLGEALTGSKRQEAWSKVAEVLREVKNPFAMLQAGQPTQYAWKSDKDERLTKMVRSLKTAAESDLAELTTNEKAKISNYQQRVATTNVEIKANQQFLTQRKEELAKAQQDAAALTKLKAQLTNIIKADSALLSKTKANLSSTTQIHRSNVESMDGELKALSECIAILSGDAAKGGLGQKVAANTVSFIQIKGTPVTRVAEFLRNKGTNLRSKMLVQLAESVGAGGPFDKVKKMIQDMINKLKTESTAETSKNQWCENELNQNKINTQNEEDNVTKYTNEKAQADAKSKTAAKLKKEKTEELEVARKEQSDLTQVRNKDRADNEESIAATQDGIAACEKAIGVLESYYSSQTALLQQPANAELTANPGYTPEARTTDGSGPVTLVRGLHTKMTETLTTLQVAESMAQKNHEGLTKSFKELEAQLETDITEQGRTEQEQKVAAAAAKSSLDDATKNLQNYKNEYDTALAPQCVETGVSFETRAQARAEEIQSLQEALQILSEM